MTHPSPPATPLDEVAWDALLGELRAGWEALDDPRTWPERQLAALGQHGVHAWFVPVAQGGAGWSDAEVLRGLMKLASACLTTTFVLTQRVAAVSRIVASEQPAVRSELLPGLLSGASFATVGISHLTTSRRHLETPVLAAEQRSDGYVLRGYSPWVTGAAHADTLVVGATLADGEQVLLAVPGDTPGVSVAPAELLVALGASHTARVEFVDALVPAARRLRGPAPQVLQAGATGRTGGAQTSALALGLADRALDILEAESARRAELVEPSTALRGEWKRLREDMLSLASDRPACTNEQLRQRANSLVLRVSQAALSASKGAGYVQGHPVGRICREALFFLVWSCPQPVSSAHLCELAGLA